MKIKKTVEELVNRYHTRNPLEIADRMGISVTRDPLGDIQGYYILYSGVKCICINSEIEDMNEIRVIAGHELGHAVLHETERCMFYPNTLFSRNESRNPLKSLIFTTYVQIMFIQTHFICFQR